MTREVSITTRQYCNYNPLYSLAPSKIITSKRRDQSSPYVYVALFILEKTTLFIVTTTPSTIKVVSARQLRTPATQTAAQSHEYFHGLVKRDNEGIYQGFNVSKM